MKEYEINTQTLAILPINKNKSKVMEKTRDFTVNLSCKEIINNSCNFFGSSYEGRVLGTKALTGITHKAPIIIEEINKIIFFPTKSSRVSSCSWISYNNVLRYEKLKNGVIITFYGGKKLKIDVSYRIIDNQILRSTRLESTFNKRIDIII